MWWKGVTRLGSGSGGRSPRVLYKKVSAHHVLRAGLRSVVVALGPVLSRPLAHPYRGLRPFPRGACRAGSHPRQDRGGGVTAPDGTLARRVAVVRCSAGPPYWGHPYRCSDQRLRARCPAFLLRSRVGWLVDPLADVLHPAPDPRPRRRLGGAWLQRLRPAALANRSLSPLCWPNLGRAVVLLAPAVLYYRSGPLE